MAVFFDINALLNITGIIEELKIFLALTALVYLKFKRPDLKGTIKVTSNHTYAALRALKCLKDTAV